jgi:hypothetical protein
MPCEDKCGKCCKRCLKLSKKYIDERCVYKLTINDIPTNIITNTTFSFSDIAKDILKIEQKVYSNEVIQKFIKDPLIFDPVLINRANRVLVNICLNVINDPSSPAPEGFVKRATIVSTDGNVMVDVTTYKDDPEGILIGLDKNKNIINMRSYQNIYDKPQNTLNPVNYFDNISLPKSSPYLTQDFYFNSNNIDPKGLSQNNPGLVSHEINVLVFSDKNYTYPADEINPLPTGGTGTRFQTIINHGVREEIQQARIQDWGWASRRSSTLNQRANYYVAHDTDLSVDGYSITLRMAYLKYK